MQGAWCAGCCRGGAADEDRVEQMHDAEVLVPVDGEHNVLERENVQLLHA